jgi:hypothetical protein
MDRLPLRDSALPVIQALQVIRVLRALLFLIGVLFLISWCACPILWSVPRGQAQLPLLLRSHGNREGQSLTGCWSAGERYLSLSNLALFVNVWFHFFEGGESIVSLRTRDQQQPSRVHGRWWVEEDLLVVSFGGGTIRSVFILQDEVLQWAGETLVRLPDQTASLPFGINLPYRLSLSQPLPA